MREQARDRGLAGAGRPPKHERAERARGQHARERAVGPDQRLLSYDFGELLRAQLVGERPGSGVAEARGLEKARAGPPPRARAPPFNPTEICWPPRKITICQTRVGTCVTRARSLLFAIVPPFTDTITSPR